MNMLLPRLGSDEDNRPVSGQDTAGKGLFERLKGLPQGQTLILPFPITAGSTSSMMRMMWAFMRSFWAA